MCHRTRGNHPRPEQVKKLLKVKNMIEAFEKQNTEIVLMARSHNDNATIEINVEDGGIHLTILSADGGQYDFSISVLSWTLLESFVKVSLGKEK
jgi:hypothetical protein